MARFLALSRWALIGLILGTMLAPAAYTLTTGQHFVTVDGRSMTPTYRLGDLILVGHATRADFAPGHVITVRATDGTLYTHRVIAIDHGQAQLKGDGNAVADPRLVPYNHVVGAVRGHIAQPAATVLGAVLEWPTRIFLAVIIIALLFLPTGTSPSAAAGREKRSTGARRRHRATDTAQRDDDDTRPILLEHLFTPNATSAHQEAAGERQHRQDNA